MARANRNSILRPGKGRATLEYYQGPILPGPDLRDQTQAVPSLERERSSRASRADSPPYRDDDGRDDT